MRFYAHDPKQASGDWSEFFPEDDEASLLARQDGNVPPHIGLLGSFFELYRQPQALLNDFTARHMDFQFKRVLRFEPRPAQPDHAHLLLELKKGVAPLAVTPEQAFSAGKDDSGVELLYKPVREVVVGHGQVAALHSAYRDSSGCTSRQSPIRPTDSVANSTRHNPNGEPLAAILCLPHRSAWRLRHQYCACSKARARSASI